MSPQPTETDRDTCPAEGNSPKRPALLSPGDTVTKENTGRLEEGGGSQERCRLLVQKLSHGCPAVHYVKALGRPLVCPLFEFRNQPIATPRAASELHSWDAPDLKGMARRYILRTRIQRPEQLLTASSASRRRRSEPQRHGERRSARESVRTPAIPRGALREEAFPPAGGWRGSGAARWRGGWVRGGGPPPPRYQRPRHNHLSSKQRTSYSLFRKVADSDSLGALFLFRRRFVSPERLPYGQISAAQTGKGKSEPRKRGKGGRHGQMSACYRLSWIP